EQMTNHLALLNSPVDEETDAEKLFASFAAVVSAATYGGSAEAIATDKRLVQVGKNIQSELGNSEERIKKTVVNSAPSTETLVKTTSTGIRRSLDPRLLKQG